MTVKIPQAIQEFIQGKQGWVATASADGMPNIAIKGSLRMLDDEHLMFADLFSMKTRKNLSENPKVAVMVSDGRQCYLFKGMAEVITEGPLFDQIVEGIKQRSVHSVVRISIESIFNQSVGPEAGKQIA
jgi:predicted pyridoxine 5'-phosphate oxidase superfamily flavin-nucleotide-binding protein